MMQGISTTRFNSFRTRLLAVPIMLALGACGGGGGSGGNQDTSANPDTIAPIITLNGANPLTVEIGDAYIEAGAIAQDDVDGDLSAVITIDSSALDTSTIGSYSLSYSVTDAAGNATTQTRSVEVVDTTPPVITLSGANPLTLEVGGAYTEAGAMAQDNVDGDLSATIAIDSSALDTSALGSYGISYSVIDAAGNSATLTRLVEMVDTTPPVITLSGANPLTLEVGDTYAEPGAMALDNVDGDLSGAITIDSSALDTSNAGSYVLSYQVADLSGNAALVTRTVEVTDTLVATVKVTFPTKTSLTHEDSVTVRGTASDLGGVANISINGIDATTTDNFTNWSVEVPLNTGQNTLDVTAIDNAGNIDSQAENIQVTRHEPLDEPLAITIDSDNKRALVLDDRFNALVEVNLDTGLRSVISQQGVPDLVNRLIRPVDIALDKADNRVLVVDFNKDAILAIDLDSGARTLISDDDTPNAINPLNSPQALALDSDNKRVLVVDSGLNAVVEVDLTTGARRIISDNNTPNALNPFAFPKDIVLDSLNNRVLVIDINQDAVMAVDLTTGAREIVSDDTIPNATNPLSFPEAMALDSANNRLYVLEKSTIAVLVVDLSSGERNIISDNVFPDTLNVLRQPEDIEFDGINNRLLLVDKDSNAVLSVDIATGARTILSQDATPDALNPFDRPFGLALDPGDNRILVADTTQDAILAVELDTGARSILSNDNTPNANNPLDFPKEIVTDSTNNRLLVLDINLNAIIAVNLSTGSRSIISDNNTPNSVNPFNSPKDIVLDSANNRLLVSDENLGLGLVLTVDLASGARSITSDSTTPDAVNSLINPQGLELDANNNRILVADEDLEAVVAVDLDTGARTILSDKNQPNSIGWTNPRHLALDSSLNRVLVSNNGNRVYTVDLTTGERSFLADLSTTNVGGGPVGFQNMVYDSDSKRILVTDENLNAVMAVDPVNGERVILSK